MIISPPFLPDRSDGQSEDEWIDACMNGDGPGLGAYPLSYKLCWHGGLHLTAPFGYYGLEQRVRAIADGIVVFVRVPSDKPAGEIPPDHAQAYGGGWSDNGVVVLKHTTEIGEGASAAVVFFSIYMHLCAVDPAVISSGPIYRKDVVGSAGEIIGLGRRIHFEIVCDDANLRRLIGHAGDALSLNEDGRHDALYGEIYYLVPGNTPVFNQQPMLDNATAMSKGTGHPPHPVALQPVAITQDDLIVGIDYVEGDRWTTTYRIDGTQLGDPLLEEDAEYTLHDQANNVSNSFPAGHKPAPSAIFELLRFGRVIGPDALVPPALPHWRCIRHHGGQGWVNLNTAGVHRFSDADFPPWRGWRVIDDSAGRDSRCDSPILRGWLDVNGDGRVGHDEAQARLSDRGVAGKLKKTICKYSTEWDATEFDKRWGWLKEPNEEIEQPMSADTFERMRAHVEIMAFWNAQAIGLPAVHWRFEPREFIRHFRKCGWLSEQELIRCIPATYKKETGDRGTSQIMATISSQTAAQRVRERDPAVLMRVFRKYGIDMRQRLAHYLSQVYRETGVLLWHQELASGAEYEARVDIGNTEPGDGVRFKGRGLIQVTGRDNYTKYSNYRGKMGAVAFTVEPNNFLVGDDTYNCVDSSGLYWIERGVGGGKKNLSRVADMGVGEEALKTITRRVNGAEDGPKTALLERRSYLHILLSVLLDRADSDAGGGERREG